MATDTDRQSFWEHLDVLRAAIVKSLLVAVVFGVAAFCFKEELFAVILAPKDADFITYRLLYSLSGLITEAGAPDFLVKLINTGLAEQFIIHMKAALCAGILCTSPYILYQLFRFVSPALYVNERKYRRRLCHVRLGCGGQLLSDFPADVPFLGNLSGQRRGGEHDCPAILHFNADDHVAGNGTCFRNTDSIVAVRQIGIAISRFHAQIPQCGHSCGGCHYYADL